MGSRLEYTPIAVQDECLGGSEKDPRVFVIVKMQAQGRGKVYTRFDVREFPTPDYLDKWLEETGIPVVPEKDFRGDMGSASYLLAKASDPHGH